MVPILVLLMAGVYALVYMSGGVKYVYLHAMYIPILLSGIVFGMRGGVVIGLLAGLVLGPIMPLEVSTGEPQKLFSWLYRSGFFILIGFLCGVASDSVRSYLRHIKWLFHHDLSSGLPNRSALCEQLTKIFAAQDKQSDAYVLAIISIENEKELLSTFGVSVLDSAITQLVTRLQQKEAQILSIFRINTMQLCMLISCAHSLEGERFFVQLSTRFREPIRFQEISIHLDVRMGSVALTDVQTPPEAYLQQAESALAEACNQACDHVSFNPAISTASKENLLMLGELKNALAQKQLALHYQPKVDMASGKVHGVEALMRWNHPQKRKYTAGYFYSPC